MDGVAFDPRREGDLIDSSGGDNEQRVVDERVADDLRSRQSSILCGMRRRNDAVITEVAGTPGGRTLRVATYNAGLLIAPPATVPGVRARGTVLPPTLLQLDADIIVLQEVWNIRYRRALEQELPEYQAFFVPKGHRGLVTLIRRSLIDRAAGEPKMEELIFPSQRLIEQIVYHKAAVAIELWLEGLAAPVHIVNFHLLSGSAERIRLAQVNELSGRLLQSRIDTRQGHLIVGGDLNGAVYYQHDEYVIHGRKTRGWRRNCEIYNALVSKAELLDSFAAIHGDAEILASESADGGDIAWATQDLNNLLATRTHPTRREPSQRVDFVFVRSLGASNRVVVREVELGLKDRFVPFRGEKLELSDHYSYTATLTLF